MGLKVLAVSSYGRLGGAELALRTLLAARPADVDALALVIGSGPLPARLADAGIPAWSAPALDGRPSLTDLLRFRRAMLRLLSRERPDVIFAVGLKAAIFSLAGRRLGPPIVWYKVDFTLDSVLAKPLASAVDAIVSVSQAATEALGERLRERRLLAVLPPPVPLDPAIRARAEPDRATVGALGTLMPIKGYRHLILAVSQLVREFPEIQLVIGGADALAFPEHRQELSGLAERLGIAGAVKLPGFVDPAAFLEHLDVYVSATYRDGRYGFEGLSGAMLEASWVGLPIVATNGGGTPEGVIDGVTGTLVEPGDPAALAEAIAALLRDRERAQSMGREGRAFAQQRFAPRELAASLFAQLQGLVG